VFFIQWLPSVVARRTAELQVVQLVVKMDIRRSKRTLLSLVDPLPPVPIRRPRVYPNTIVEALKIKTFINSGQTRITWAKTCRELNMSESKLAHLLKIVNRLPADFIENMKSCDDQETLRIFTGRRLLNISRLKTLQERRDMIKHLLLPKT
jgi:AraC-like DNA-binding protein